MTKRTTRISKNGHSGPRVESLYNGDYVLVRGVSPALLDQVQALVKDPEIPVYTTEDGSVLENPNDPAYHRALKAAQDLRDRRAMHAIISFGMQLCDENGNVIDPPNDGWEFRLKRVGINWREEIEAITGPLEEESEIATARREAYLLLVAVSAPDMPLIARLAGAPEEAQAKAEAMFQRSEERGSDS